MRIRFWGTRGSIPKPGPATVRYGGNTSCVEVRTASGVLILLDCGTGAQDFGQTLLAEPQGPRRGHVFISHTHWDHIQGLPFLAPLFVADFEWDIYGPRGLGPSIRETLAGQMQYAYFPITIEQFEAKVRYHDLVEGELQIDDVRVRAHYMNHPALTLGYRIEADGASVVYATDHEPHSQALAKGERGPLSADECQYAAFVDSADLLIHDGQFTLGEYSRHVGWGHSPVEFAVDLAAAGRVRQLALFHHDPMRNDEGVDRLVALARQHAAGTGVDVFGAAEGLTIELAPAGATRAEAPAPAALQTPHALPAPADRLVLVAADPDPAGVLSAAVLADGARLLCAQDTDGLLRLAADQAPTLVFVQLGFGGQDALALCRQLHTANPAGPEPTDVVIVALRAQDIDLEAGAAAGVKDWLLWPFKETYARTRMHCWLLRQACHWSAAAPPPDEDRRLQALHGLRLLDTPAEERFDRYTRIAAGLFDVPIALVSLVDHDRQWFKSRHGLDATESPRDTAFCAHAILARSVMQVPDALQNPRFADNPLVVGPPRVRFYAGAPLSAADGSRVGTLCLIDRRPRELGSQQIGLLRDLADLVEAELARPGPRSAEPQAVATP
jgi:phosphoribosyl 1,2-cyclic phosphodiesterase/GAF domain-containing protein